MKEKGNGTKKISMLYDIFVVHRHESTLTFDRLTFIFCEKNFYHHFCLFFVSHIHHHRHHHRNHEQKKEKHQKYHGMLLLETAVETIYRHGYSIGN